MEELVAECGCKAGYLPSSYLSLPLGASHKSVDVSDPIEERFRRRLTAWKWWYISKWMRVTLIQSSLVKWTTMYIDKKEGGLEVWGLYKLNKSRLCKCNCCFSHEKDSFWRIVIRRKLENLGG